MSLKTLLGCTGLLFCAAANTQAADRPGGLEVELGMPQVLSWVPPIYPKEAADKKI